MTARVLIWNLERTPPGCGRGAQAVDHRFLMAPDVMVITETRTTFAERGGHTLWSEPPRTTRHDADERTVLLSRRPFTEVDRVGAPGLEAAFTPLSIVTGGTPEGAARPGIDHIALSRHLRPERVWGRPNDVAGHRLSDHDGSGADIIAVTT